MGDKLTGYRNFENSPPEHLPDLPGMKVVVVRHYLNWVASLVKSAEDRPTYDWASVIRLYRPITQEYFCPNHFISHARIYYDYFIEERGYREFMCYKLGGKYNEEMLDKVPANGGGSSFDRLTFDGKGSAMNTKERWKQILDTDLKDAYIVALRSFKQNAKYFMTNFETTGEEDKFIINTILYNE